MYVYFDKQGIVKEYINDNVVCGTHGAKIYAMYELDQDTPFDEEDINIRYIKIDGTPSDLYECDDTISEMLEPDRNRDLRFFKYGKTYRFRVFEVPDDILLNETDKAKVVSATISYDNSHIMNLFSFMVQPSAIGGLSPQDYISIADYNFLLNKIREGGTIKSVNGKDGGTTGEVVLDATDLKLTTNQQTIQANFIRIDGELERIEEESVHYVHNITINGTDNTGNACYVSFRLINKHEDPYVYPAQLQDNIGNVDKVASGYVKNKRLLVQIVEAVSTGGNAGFELSGITLDTQLQDSTIMYITNVTYLEDNVVTID